jgi:transcription factor SPN1
MPEAGHDPGDPLAPEIEEENSTPDPPIANPSLDVELTGENEVDKDDYSDDSDKDDLESILSEVDEAQFDDFDPAAVALGDRSAVPVDGENVRQLGVHKRKRTEGVENESAKKKKREGKREKTRRSRHARDGSEPFSGGEEIEGKRSRKSRAEPEAKKSKGAAAEVDEEENLSPEEREFTHCCTYIRPNTDDW